MSRAKKIGDVTLHLGDPREVEGLDSIDDLYQRCLRQTQAPRKRTYLWGSDAGVCPRKNLYNQEIPVPFNYYPSTKGYMAYGVAMENLLADSLADHNRLIKQDIRLVELESSLIPHLRISGKMDIICLDHQDELALVECKTCGALPSRPKVNHLKQLLIYAAVSGFNNCYITYVSRKVSTSGSKGKLDMISFPIEIDDTILYEVLYTACLSQCCMDEKKAVPIPSGFRKHHECAWCDFDSYCWPYDESPIELFSRSELDRVKHLSMNAADELLKQREGRYIETLSGLLLHCTSDALEAELERCEKEK